MRISRSRLYHFVVSAWICTIAIGCTTAPPPPPPPAMQPRVTQLPPTTTPTVAAANTSGPTLSEPDGDGDEVADRRDNCPFQFNPDQADRDLDGAGDACEPQPTQPPPSEPDSDGDGTADADDNCPGKFNPDQADRDLDGQGDDCETTPNLKPTEPVGPRPGEPDVVATVGGALK